MNGAVAIAGGGLAGLVAARHLAEAGADVQVFERRADVGGRVRSVRRDGYTFDRGFQVLFTAYPAARRELDFDALDLRYFTPGAVIARPGRRAALSDPLRNPRDLTASLFNTEVTVGDKLRTLKLRRELSRTSPRTIFDGPDGTTREFLREYGFSRKYVENFAGPFYGGITLDRSLTTSRKVFQFTFKMLTEGRIAVPADGMGAISEQLAAAARDAGAEIHTETTVEAVSGGAGDGAADADAELDLGGETVAADAAVVATDPKAARELTGVESIPTDAKGCVTQYFAFDGPALDAGKKLLLNATEDGPNEVVPLSAVAPEYAPDDRRLLSATYLGVPDASDADLAEEVRTTLSLWYPERNLDLDHRHTSRIEFAQFAQPPGVYETLPGVRAPGSPIYLAGEYTEASSLNAAMESGRKAARAILADLQ